MIIVAGGSGTRMKSTTPKQFIKLRGKPVLMHTIEKFSSAIKGIIIIVVLAKEHRDEWKNLCTQYGFGIKHQLADGGDSRYASVKNGLALVSDGVVGIHDAARPLVSVETIHRVFEEAELLGNASPCIPVTDSLRRTKGNENIAVNRSDFYSVQTPQCFHTRLIKKAFETGYRPEFTDDATVLEAYGEKINLIEGNKENIKITTPQDLIIAEALMATI